MILATGQTLKEAKVVMLGINTVGKSSIVIRLTRGTFSEQVTSTIGAAFLSKTIKTKDSQIKLQIWDTGGSERYRSMAPMYFQNAQVAIIVYDITSTSSFNDVDNWIKELKEKGPTSIILALVGNKYDLEKNRTITTEEGINLKNKYKIDIFKETSALSEYNINELFLEIAEKISNFQENRLNDSNNNKVILNEINKKENCC